MTFRLVHFETFELLFRIMIISYLLRDKLHLFTCNTDRHVFNLKINLIKLICNSI